MEPGRQQFEISARPGWIDSTETVWREFEGAQLAEAGKTYRETYRGAGKTQGINEGQKRLDGFKTVPIHHVGAAPVTCCRSRRIRGHRVPERAGT